MKTLINLSSLSGIVYGLFLLVSLRQAGPADVPGPAGVPVPPAALAPPAAEPFAAFPVDRPRVVDLTIDEGVIEPLTPRERRDQYRDWLLWLVVSESGLSADEINQCLHDLPSVRHGYMQPVANFEYGETRSCAIAGNRVIALIPAGSGPAREGQLCDIMDAQRKNLGNEPNELLVFEYELDGKGQTTRVTRRATEDAHAWYTPAYGYQEAVISGLDDLKRFMESVDDLTFARFGGQGLVLGGRKIKDRPFRGIRVEEVAAVWQSERSNRGRIHGSGFSLDWTYDYEKLQELVARLQSDVRSLGSDGAEIFPTAQVEHVRQALARHDREPYFELTDRLLRDKSPLAQGLGDWLEYHGRVLLRSGDCDLAGLARLLGLLESELKELKSDGPGARIPPIRRAREALAHKDSRTFFDLLDRLSASRSPIDRWLAALLTDTHRRHSTRKTTDAQGLDRIFAGLESDLSALAEGGGRSALSTVQDLREALRRDDEADLRSRQSVLGEAGGPLLTALNALVLNKAGVEFPVRRREDDPLRRLLARTEAGLQRMARGEPGVISLADVRAARRTLAQGDDLGVKAVLDRLQFSEVSEGPVSEALFGVLERNVARCRACDAPALAADLSELEAQLSAVGEARSSILSANWLGMAGRALSQGRPDEFEFVVNYLKAKPSFLATSFAIVLDDEAAHYRAGDDDALAALLAKCTDDLKTLSGPKGHLSPEVIALVASFFPAPADPAALAAAKPPPRRPDEQQVGPLMRWIDSLKKHDKFVARFLATRLERELELATFQVARYDGDLQGTEAGMVLFYTDFLAKIWAYLEYKDSHPAHLIEGFRTWLNTRVAPIYLREANKFSYTRLWFGPEDGGFLMAGGGNTLLFARVATRIYAASSNALHPGEEVEANARSRAFLGWWNDHYEEVARYEPEYERLNELMKWSLLTGWLRERNQAATIDFLKDYPVERTNWFADWVRRRPELRFQLWDHVDFHERGYKGRTTETLPLLYSAPFFTEERTLDRIMGGVSLGSEKTFVGRAALSEELPPLLRQSSSNIKKVAEGGRAFETFDGTAFRFKPPVPARTALGNLGEAESGVTSRVSSTLETVPKAGVKLRGRFSEILTPNFERIVTHEVGDLEVAARVGGQDLVRLNIGATRNGFRLGVQCCEADLAQALARRASIAPDPLGSLATHPEVEAAVRVGPDRFLVKMRGSDSLVRVSGEGAEGVRAGPGNLARVAEPTPDSRAFEVAFLDNAAAGAELNTGEYLSVEVPSGSSNGVKIATTARGPPEGARGVEIRIGDEVVRGHVDPATETLVVRRSDLPTGLRDDLGRMGRVFKNPELRKVWADAGRDTAEIRVAVKEARFQGARVAQEVHEGKFAEVADRLAKDPQGFRSALDQELADGLGACDRELSAGLPNRARFRLDSLSDAFGELPDIQLRRALVSLERGELDGAVESMNSAMSGKLRDPAGFFDEINARLKRPGLSASEQFNLNRLGETGRWREMQFHGFMPDGEVSAFTDGDRIGLRYRVAELPKGEVVKSVGDVTKGRAAVYVQDAPGLNNLDWSVSIEQTLEVVMSRDLGDVVRLPLGRIAEFSPSEIINLQSAAKYRCVTAGSTQWQPLIFPGIAQAVGHTLYHDDNDDDDDDERFAYFVTTKSVRP